MRLSTIGRCRRGLPFLTGCTVIAALNQSRYRDGGIALDRGFEVLALRLTAPCFGGYAEPVADNSFIVPRAALLAEAREWRS